jgi:hypothetical protein
MTPLREAPGTFVASRMCMNKYIFLDNWVFPLLRDPDVAAGLISFIWSNGLTVLLTSLSMVELYNPGWQGAKEGEERGAAAAQFLARVPCVIVNPSRVWEMEVAAHLSPLDHLPFELDLADLSPSLRGPTLLRFLRRDELFLDQGKDIRILDLGYKAFKETWLSEIENIIDNACLHGDLKRNKNGDFIDLESTRDIFLFSLDFRHATHLDIDTLIANLKRTRAGIRPGLTSVRLSSLCFWYSYIDIDPSNRPKRQGSDIGDFHQISLLPYCSVFTTDGTMYNTLQRIRDRVVPVNCQVMSKGLLQERLREYVEASRRRRDIG